MGREWTTGLWTMGLGMIEARRAPGVVLILVSLLGALPASGGGQPDSRVAPPPEDPETVSEKVAPDPGPTIRERVERLERSMWWNHSGLVARLELRDSQRQRMRTRFVDYFTRRLESREQAPGPDTFRRSLVAADLDGARAAIARRAERAAAAATADARVVVDVLAILRSDQLELLAARYPRVLRAAWFTELSGGRDRRRGIANRGRLRAVPPERPVAPEEPPG